MVIDVVLTCGWHFQVECHFQLVLVECHGFQLQIIDSSCKLYFLANFLLFSTRNYNWKKVGNVVGKKGFLLMP